LTDGIAYGEEVEVVASALELRDIADHALPHFMTHKLPAGVAGLIIAAIMAAAMSTISTCLNSSATIFLEDIYRKFRPGPGNLETMAVLRGATFLWGMLGSLAAILMIGVESILAVWWQLTGLVAGAMLGLFLLGFISKKADSFAAAVSVVVGILVLAWITVSAQAEWIPAFLRSPFHVYMGVVVATLSMFLVGVLIGRLRT
jgi:SSS family solute:Na+ symporter